MASPTTAAAPDAPSGSSPLSINGQPRLVGWFQEICTNFLKLLSPSGASAYDTGWVALTVSAAGYTAVQNLAVRRLGRQVYIRGAINVTSGTFPTALTEMLIVPAGFRPGYYFRDACSTYPSVAARGAEMAVDVSGSLQVGGIGASTNVVRLCKTWTVD